ncbi:hypothetical protein L483_26775 [Pseudomonas putida H8234]|nr:hypothetical protein L483_26775 [Pseudomonas putida H8234]
MIVEGKIRSIVFVYDNQVGNMPTRKRPVGDELARLVQVVGMGESGNKVPPIYTLDDSAFAPDIKNLQHFASCLGCLKGYRMGTCVYLRQQEALYQAYK